MHKLFIYEIMKIIEKLLAVILIILLTAPINANNCQSVPSLDELAGEWMDTSTLLNFPSLTNFIGGLQSTQNITAFQNFTVPPFAQMGNLYAGWNEHLTSSSALRDTMPNWSCELQVDAKSLKAIYSRWLPYEIQRKANYKEVEITSYMRMPFEQEGVLIEVVLKNSTSFSKKLALSMVMYGRIRNFPLDKWNTWSTPRPYDNLFDAEISSDNCTITFSDRSSASSVSYTFIEPPVQVISLGERGEAYWNIHLGPLEEKKIRVAFAVKKQKEEAAETSNKWAFYFSHEFELIRKCWNERWLAAFTPKNNHFSGHCPVLETNDEKMYRIYYMSILTSMYLCRTNQPISSRFFVTAGPRWANTLAYFWDLEMWATIWAMLEPKTMKEQIKKWFVLDIHNCYAIDGYSEKGAGPWYAANDWSIFRCIEAYLGVSGDIHFLSEEINGKTLLQWLEFISTYFETRPLMEGMSLADYGGSENLLECSPSYIQGVPSLNASNVYMLRKTAEYYALLGNTNKQKKLLRKAEKLLPEVLELYESGEGVWNARSKRGEKVSVRHCYDYVTIGQALEFDLHEKIKREMNQFVEKELLTSNWMRAMSLQDSVALSSDRPDHGPKGSYAAWPAMTMDIMCRFGFFDKALSFLHATEEVTHQGSYAQAYELVTLKNGERNVRATSRGGQDALEGCGAAFAEVIVRSFFGFRSDLSTNMGEPVILNPKHPRGFIGVLRHLSWNGKQYSIVSNNSGIHTILED